jgi:hypothetical protein
MSPGASESDVVRSRKLGSEDAIVVQLPPERFVRAIPPRYVPSVDDQGRYRIMLLAQDCRRCSFGDREAGAVHELHVWLQLVPAKADTRPIRGVEVSLSPQQWLALFVATDTRMVELKLRSFGFHPARLAAAKSRAGGGSIALEDGAHLGWLVAGPGRGPATVGVHHDIFLPGDPPGAAPHQVTARISDAVMGQPGELHVHGEALEPFLRSGEQLQALVHRMPVLEADIVWRPRPGAS